MRYRQNFLHNVPSLKNHCGLNLGVFVEDIKLEPDLEKLISSSGSLSLFQVDTSINTSIGEDLETEKIWEGKHFPKSPKTEIPVCNSQDKLVKLLFCPLSWFISCILTRIYTSSGTDTVQRHFKNEAQCTKIQKTFLNYSNPLIA